MVCPSGRPPRARADRHRRPLHALRTRATPRRARLAFRRHARGAPPRRPGRDVTPPSGSPATCRCRRAAVVRARRRRLGARARPARRAAARVQARGRRTPTAAPSGSATRATRSARRARSARSPCSSCRATSAPAWLEAEGVPRALRRARRSAAAGSARTSPMRVWSPADASRARRCGCCWPTTGRSTTRSRSSRASAPRRSPRGELPPHRVALLAPGDRNQWYSASAAYAACWRTTSSRRCATRSG